jgi:DNA-binding NtrC family response regulator
LVEAFLDRLRASPEGDPADAIDEVMLSPRTLAPPVLPVSGAAAESPADSSLDLDRCVAELERRLIEEALDRAHGNRTQAAKILGISRNGLAIKMERFHATKPPGA